METLTHNHWLSVAFVFIVHCPAHCIALFTVGIQLEAVIAARYYLALNAAQLD